MNANRVRKTRPALLACWACPRAWELCSQVRKASECTDAHTLFADILRSSDSICVPPATRKSRTLGSENVASNWPQIHLRPRGVAGSTRSDFPAICSAHGQPRGQNGAKELQQGRRDQRFKGSATWFSIGQKKLEHVVVLHQQFLCASAVLLSCTFIKQC